MICEYTTKRFCKEDISLIENYDKAIADETQTWHCHHRDEVKTLPSGIKVFRSREDLIEAGRYYNCPASELIFLTCSEHRRLHTTERPVSDKVRNTARELMSNMRHDSFKGRHHSKESKALLSKIHKGRKLVMINGRRHYVKPGETNN